MPQSTAAPTWIETSPTRRDLRDAQGAILGTVTRLYGRWHADLVPTAAHSATTRHAIDAYLDEAEARAAVERAVRRPPQIVASRPFRPEARVDSERLGPADCLTSHRAA